MSERVKIKETKILSNDWYILKKVSYDFKFRDGTWRPQHREVYERGNGATVLLYDDVRRKIILTRQFRLPTYLNENKDGFLLETCAGVIEGESPEACMIREIEEETGYRVPHLERLFELYMSPGAVTEIIHFFMARYTPEMKVSQGGGHMDEQEDIDVMELDFDLVREMVTTHSIRDAKTLVLLQHAILRSVLGDKKR